MRATDDTRHIPVGEFSLAGDPPHLSHKKARAVTGAGLIAISHRLRPRDYTIASLLHQHTVLTTDQIAALLFANRTTCRHRLTTLCSLGFVDRFLHLRRPGVSSLACWVAGPLSARLSALATGDSPPNLRTLRERQDRIYVSPTLNHLIDTNAFFVQLLAHARAHPHTALLRWWSERDTTAAFGRRIRPDGHGVWADQGGQVGFFLEMDRGTESLGRLVDKLGPYRRLRVEGGPDYPVLFVLPDRVREQNLHRRLADAAPHRLAVATTSPESGRDPAGHVWRLAGNGRHRLALAELPGAHGEPGPLNPGAPTLADHPLLHSG